MVKPAFLVDIYDAPRDTVYQSFIDSVELNGNPFYHKWRIDSIDAWDDPQMVKRKTEIDNWLKNQGLTKNDTVIITGGW